MSSICYGDIDQNCDVCYQLTQGNCDDITVSVGLVSGTVYWLWCVSPDGNIYKSQVTISAPDILVIDLSNDDYPNGLFTKYSGKFEFFLSGSSIYSTPVQMTIGAEAYNCIIINWTVNCCNNT